MVKGKHEEYNPKRRPRKPSDPIPDDELMDALKEAFPGSEEITKEKEYDPFVNPYTHTEQEIDDYE